MKDDAREEWARARDRAAAWFASVGAIAGYAMGALTEQPVLRYFPRLGTWGMHEIPGEPGIRWFGWIVNALAGALIGASLGLWWGRRPSWHWVWALAAAALVALAWHERGWFRGGG